MRPVQNGRNQPPKANQIFFWALTGDCKSLRSALESGVSVNLIDPVTTDSPLMIACRKGHTEVVRLCLEFGAKNDPHPEFGQTALHASISEQKYESARVLLEVAAESDAAHIISNLSDPSGQTPLHTAAYIGSAQLIELLLYHGAEISSVDIQGQTVLHLCASSGVKSCLAMLLDHGGDELIDIQDKGGHTALHHASFHGRLDCVRLLLETAADVNIRNYEGMTSYNLASAQGHHQIGLLLLEYRDIHSASHNNNNNNVSNSSNFPTPVKSSTRGPSPHFQTPPSISKYSRNVSHDSYHNNIPPIDFSGPEDASEDLPEHEVRLNIRLPENNNLTRSTSHGPHNHPTLTKHTALSLSVPVNPLSSMYGSNNGLEKLDSIGNFLPRPHTVSSPVVSGRNSARSSPVIKGSNGFSQEHNGDGSSNLTQLGIAQHNRAHSNGYNNIGHNDTLYQSFGLSGKSHNSDRGPSSPHSPGTHDNNNYNNTYTDNNNNNNNGNNGTGNNNIGGYKILAKSALPLSRQSSLGAAEGSGDYSAKIQLFDGIPTYTKSSLPTHTRTNSITSNSNNSNGNLAATGGYGGVGQSNEEANPYTQYNNSSSYANNSTTDASSNVFTAREGVNPILVKKNNFTSIHNTDPYTTTTTTATVANCSGRNLTELCTDDTNINYPYPTSINTTTSYSSVPASPAHAPRRSNFGSENSFEQPEEASENYEFADPIEVFVYLQIEWKVYITEHGDVYYLDMSNEHSQWDDPRIVGIVYHNIDAPTESPSYKTHTPPKSPSPKGLEKGKTSSFHFNPHSYSQHNSSNSTEESPRVKDIKPIKLNWAGKGSHTNNNTKPDAHKNNPKNTFHESPASSEDEAVTALKVRYPRAHLNSNGTSHMTLLDAEDDDNNMDNSDEEQLELAHITAQLDFESSATDDATTNTTKATHNSSGSRIKELSKHFNKTTTVPSVPINSSVSSGTHAILTLNQSPIGKGKSIGVNRKDATSPTTAPLVRKTTSSGSSTTEAPAVAVVSVVAPVSNVPTTTEDNSTDKPTSHISHTTTTTTITNTNEDLTRAAADIYITQLLSGRTLQEISECMDKDGRSQMFKMQVLEWADEALILGTGVSSNEGATTPISKSSTTATTSLPTETIADLKSDPIFAKYAKMLSMGVPPQNVLMKMKIEHIDVSQRNRLMRAAGQAEEIDPSVATTNSTDTTTAVERKVETIVELKEDPILCKYAKMISMGVPPQNVLMKMKVENIEIAQRNRLMRAAGQEEEIDPNHIATGNHSHTTTTTNSRRPSASLQNLHWNTLPAERLKNSIWSHSSIDQNSLAEHDLQELERLFGNSTTVNSSFATTRTLGALAETQKESLQLKHLDKKRAQNIVIGLNPFKSLGTHVEILKAMCSLDDMEGKIHADHIDNFKGLLPTEAELKRIDKIQGSKHPAELFFQAVMVFYPELPVRLNCFSQCLSFEGNCSAILVRTRKLINACNQVLSSNNLAKLLQRMLLVGNIMNEGTRRGGASGFTLDSLSKMVNTKGTDKKTSVLDYVVKSLYDKDEEYILLVLEDLNLVEETAKLSGNEIIKEFASIRAALDSLQQVYEFNHNKTNNAAFNSPTAKKMIDAFSTRLEHYLSTFQGQMNECEKNKLILSRKIDDIIRYFGEDSKSCDTSKIFGTLQEFLKAVAFSKAAVEWKLYRSQSSTA